MIGRLEHRHQYCSSVISPFGSSHTFSVFLLCSHNLLGTQRAEKETESKAWRDRRIKTNGQKRKRKKASSIADMNRNRGCRERERKGG